MMMNSPLVTILMATYNGSKHIREQLDSLIEQHYTNWELIVHDDGSSDDTVTIIKGYAGQDRRIRLIEDGVTGLGAAHNYLHLMQQADGDFFMFCDQDDVWMEEKVGRMVAAAAPYNGPAAVYSNSYLYTGEDVLRQKSTIFHPSKLRNTLFFNSGIQGCSLIFNRHLMELLRPFPETVAMHDHLVTMGAVSFGTIAYLDEVLMYYRQHELNVSGNQPLGYFQKIRSFLFGGTPVVSRSHYEANQAFYRRYHSLIDEASRRLFNAYFRYANSRSVFERLSILLKNRFTLGSTWGVLYYKTLVRKPIN